MMETISATFMAGRKQVKRIPPECFLQHQSLTGEMNLKVLLSLYIMTVEQHPPYWAMLSLQIWAMQWHCWGNEEDTEEEEVVSGVSRRRLMGQEKQSTGEPSRETLSESAGRRWWWKLVLNTFFYIVWFLALNTECGFNQTFCLASQIFLCSQGLLSKY